MARKLGEILVDRGACTPERVLEALQNQVIFGGRLGTNLLELGAVKEDDLASALALRYGLPAVSGEDLVPDPEALRLLRPEVADRCDAVPFQVEDRKLVALVVNPLDFSALDEIAFATDRNVLPVVAPEARVWALLLRHYGIARQLRGIAVNFDPATTVRPPPAPTARPAQADGDLMDQADFDALYSRSTPPEGEEILDLSEMVEPPRKKEPLPEVELEASPPPRTAGKPFRSRATQMALQAVLYRPTAGTPAAPTGGATTPPVPPALRPPPPTVPERPPDEGWVADGPQAAPLGFADALRALEGVEDRDAIARIVLRHAQSRFRRAVLLTVRQGAAWGWAGRGEGLDPAVVHRVRIALGQPGAIDTVVSTRAHHLGPLARTEANVRLLKQLGGGVPRSSVLLPVLAQGRVVNVLYADAGRGADVDADAVGDLLILASRIAQSWERLLAKVQ